MKPEPDNESKPETTPEEKPDVSPEPDTDSGNETIPETKPGTDNETFHYLCLVLFPVLFRFQSLYLVLD